MDEAPMTAINDTLNVTREPPRWRSFSKRYWDATRERKLLVQFDPKTQRYQYFPRACGNATGNSALEWREVSGKGKVFSYTIAKRSREPFAGHEPFFIVLVTLDEGVNVMANMVNCSLEKMTIGLRVIPYWMPLSNGTHLLMFEPDRAG
jgi:uncharacterized OB-fold protein